MRTRTLTRTSLVLPVAVSLAIGLSACGSDESNGNSGSATDETADIGGEEDHQSALQMGTANPGGGYFSLGTEYSNIFENEAEVEGLSVSAIETGGSVENLAKIGRGELQLGLAQASTAIQVIAGTGEFEDADVQNAGLLGCLEPYALHVVTLEGTGVESIEDAEGARVAIGAPGSANQLASNELLSAYGLEAGDDYTALEEASDDARDKLRNGNLEIVIDMQTIPFPGLQELSAGATSPLLLGIEDAPLQQLVDETVFAEFEIPAESYDFLAEPVPTVSDWSCLFASTDQVSPEVAYDLTRITYEHAGDLTMAAKDVISVDTALEAAADLELHPGAESYFQDSGVLD